MSTNDMQQEMERYADALIVHEEILPEEYQLIVYLLQRRVLRSQALERSLLKARIQSVRDSKSLMKRLKVYLSAILASLALGLALAKLLLHSGLLVP